MAEAIRRDIEIRLRAIDDTASGVNSATRNVGRVGQAADRSSEIGLAPIRRTPGYSPLERDVRDAQAAELRAIRVQTQRAELQARSAYVRGIARENLGLTDSATVAAGVGRGVVGGVVGGGGARGGLARVGLGRAAGLIGQLAGARGLGGGGALAALGVAERLSGLGNAVVDGREASARTGATAWDDVKEEAKGLAPFREAGRFYNRVLDAAGPVGRYSPVRLIQNTISRATGGMTIAEEQASRLEEQATAKRIEATKAEIEVATERRKAAINELSQRRRGRLSALMGASFDTAQALQDFDGARKGKKLSGEEKDLRDELVRDAEDAQQVDVYNRLSADRQRDLDGKAYFADQARQRDEFGAGVVARQRQVDEEMARQRRRADLMARQQAVEDAGDGLERARSAYGMAEAAGPVRVGNDLTGDAGALFGIGSTGNDSSARVLNQLKEAADKQLRTFEAAVAELKAMNKRQEAEELL